MNNKGQSISINTIIVAAIALAVLVVLFAIFTGRIGGFSKGVQETDTCSQKCNSLNMNVDPPPQSEGQSCISANAQRIGGTYKDGPYGCCCMPKP